MSTSDKKRRPLRKLIFLAVLAGIAVAIKNALEDKGGSYEAPAHPSSASVPTPPVPNVKVVTAEDDIVERRPVENLDEFADPVEPAAEAEDPHDVREVPGKVDPFGIR